MISGTYATLQLDADHNMLQNTLFTQIGQIYGEFSNFSVDQPMSISQEPLRQQDPHNFLHASVIAMLQISR